MTVIKALKADITQIKVDAIVNAANTSLLGGGGVDGAIHRKGGPDVLRDCMKIRARQRGCETGKAVITTAGNLPATFVIHTVGPIWNKGLKGEDKQLENCYVNALLLAEEHGLQSIAFPNISTGIYRFPKSRAAQIAISTVRSHQPKTTSLNEVIFVCFDEENYQWYVKLLNS